MTGGREQGEGGSQGMEWGCDDVKECGSGNGGRGGSRVGEGDE